MAKRKPALKEKTWSRRKTRPGDPPSPRQADAYRHILTYFAEHGHPPTFRDVAELDGKDTAAAVSFQLRALAAKGLIVLPRDGRARGIEVPKVRDAVRKAAARLLEGAKGMKTLPRRGGEAIKPGDLPTPLQANVYRLLLKYFAEHGQPPTQRNLADLGGVSSTTVVLSHLKALHKRGLVQLHQATGTRGRARGIEVPKLREVAKATAAKLLADAP